MKSAHIVGCCSIIVILTVVGVLIGISFSKLQANEVGLDYSANSLTIDTSKLYPAGVHFIGVGHSFLKYPKNVQELDLKGADTIYARTSDGLSVEIQARLLYRLKDTKEALASLYLMFGEAYTEQYVRTCRTTIRDVASEFTAFQFWESRENITQRITDDLSVQLNDLYARVDTFLLTNYELPDAFQSALTETDVKKQEREKVQFEEETVRKETETRIKKAAEDVKIINLRANATAEASLLAVEADVVRVQTAVKAEVNAYRSLKQDLGWTDEELINYVWLDSLASLEGTEKTISLNSPKTLIS